MTPDSPSAAKKTYRAGDIVTAKLTLKPVATSHNRSPRH